MIVYIYIYIFTYIYIDSLISTILPSYFDCTPMTDAPMSTPSGSNWENLTYAEVNIGSGGAVRPNSKLSQIASKIFNRGSTEHMNRN